MENIKIPYGYYIKARKIQDSEIMRQPPHVREIWDWLLKEANHTDVRLGGRIIKRGQLLRNYQDIQEGLAWYVGWRKMMYNENQVKKAVRFLRKANMIETQKMAGGVLITVCNYDYYQNPDNYKDAFLRNSYERTNERTNEGTTERTSQNHTSNSNNTENSNSKSHERTTERTTKELRKNQGVPTINNNDNNDNNDNIYIYTSKSYPKSCSNSYPKDFLEFWKVYPRKEGKRAAYMVWKRLKKEMPPLKELLSVIEKQKESDQWRQNGGKFIPHPRTWLNQGRWEDVPLMGEEDDITRGIKDGIRDLKDRLGKA